jgi:hypothetical protein
VDVGGKVTKIVFKGAGFREILRSAAVVRDLSGRGRAIAAAANGAAGQPDAFGSQSSVGAQRARVVVATETRAGAAAEATNKVLTRSIGAGRG